MPERWHTQLLSQVERLADRTARKVLRDRAVGFWGTVIDPDSEGDVLVRVDGQDGDTRCSLAPSVSVSSLDRVIVQRTPDRRHVVTIVVEQA